MSNKTRKIKILKHAIKFFLILPILVSSCDNFNNPIERTESSVCHTPFLTENFNGNVFSFRDPFEEDIDQIDSFTTFYLTSDGVRTILYDRVLGIEYIPDIAYLGEVINDTEFEVTEAIVHQSFLQFDENDPFAVYQEELDIDTLSVVGVNVPASGTIILGENQQSIILENIIVNGIEEIIIRTQDCLEQLSEDRPGDDFFINELNAILNNQQ